MVAAELTGSDDARRAQAALRSVRVEHTGDQVSEDTAKMVLALAMGNVRTVQGSFSRSLATVSRSGSKGVEISGVLAVVAEYGMVNRGWYYWGRRKAASPIPPPRAVRGRPKPEDGHVIGKAWRRVRAKANREAADSMLDEYTIAFDKHRVPKGGRI
jgi:hypothetical protein